MKVRENMEKLIRRRKPHITTGSDTDKRILDDSFVAMDETIRGQSVDGKPNTCKRIVQSRITKFAAAVIIIAIVLFVVHSRPVDWTEPPEVLEVTKSPAELTTFASLTFAYRRGGMEMVEQMCDKALKMAGQRPANISLQEFFEEINNGKTERTEL